MRELCNLFDIILINFYKSFLIYRYKTSKAMDLVKNGLYILDQWEATYIKCKKDIEAISAVYFRRWAWEFDEDIIFHRLHFVRLIVRDLDKIMKVN